mgnify:CR=1 FL=1
MFTAGGIRTIAEQGLATPRAAAVEVAEGALARVPVLARAAVEPAVAKRTPTAPTTKENKNKKIPPLWRFNEDHHIYNKCYWFLYYRT